MSDIKIKSIVVDTFTAFQKNEILEKWEKGKAQLDDWKDYGTDIVLFIRQLNAKGFTCVGVVGYEGSGKSFGMKALPSGTNVWFNADDKNATWKGGKEEYGTKNSPTRMMKLPKSYKEVIDVVDSIKQLNLLADEPIAFLLAHIEDYKSVGGQQRQRLKTMGKLANKMNIEDMFNICYYAEVKREGNVVNYTLRTQNSGFDNCRTLEGLHESLHIPNDFNKIIEAIDKY